MIVIARAVALVSAVVVGLWAGHALTATGHAPETSRAERALAALDRARVDGRLALARAPTRQGQGRAAHRLAHAHRAAAASLPSSAGALTRVADAYAALERAAAAGSTSGFRRARASVGAAEGRLASSAARPAPQREPARRTPALLIAVLLALLGVAPALTRRRRSSVPAVTPDPAPPVDRWDAPPRPSTVRPAPARTAWTAPAEAGSAPPRRQPAT
jgi:hypothetical protein